VTICAECDAGFHSQCAGANGCDCDCNYEDLTRTDETELDIDDFEAYEEESDVRTQ